MFTTSEVYSEPDKSESQMGLTTRCLKLYLLAILVTTCAAWSIILFRGTVQHRPYPFNSLLFHPSDRFADVMRFAEKMPKFLASGFFDAGEIPQWIYPPASLFLLASLYATQRPLVAITAFTLLIGLVGAGAIWLFCWIKKRSNWLVFWVVAASLASSYPFLFLIDRGNMEAFVMLFVAMGVVSFLSERFQASGICFAVAMSIKPFPIAFFFLLIRKRRFREIAIAAGFALLVNFIALYRMGPDLSQNIHGLLEGLSGFNKHSFSMDTVNVSFDHTLFSALKQMMRVLTRTPVDQMGPLIQAARVPYAFTTVALGLACIFKIWKLPLINQVFALTILTILCPYVSYDYTLIQLYVPWALFFLFLVTERHHNLTSTSVLSILLPCAIAFTPQSFLIVGESGIGGQVKALALFFLLGVACFKPFPSVLAGEVCGTDRPLPWKARTS